MTTAALERDHFEGAQRLVLTGQHWLAARTLVLSFPDDTARGFLEGLLADGQATPTAAVRDEDDPRLRRAQTDRSHQVSIGFSRRGLEALGVPRHVMAGFAAKSPAFMAGPALRASTHLRLGAAELPPHWDCAFDTELLHAVVTVHAMSDPTLSRATQAVWNVAKRCKAVVIELPETRRLETSGPQLVHFGYRDGLARVGIRGWTNPALLEPKVLRPVSSFGAGEFLLGHPQTSGPNPWLTGADRRVWPEPLRDFFRNGSFGVLQQIEQDVEAFETFVARAADKLGRQPEWLKAKLCGRDVHGSALAGRAGDSPESDFDYTGDEHGHHCPFGSHVRRMNPRDAHIVHGRRVRPLIRRGMPYGPEWKPLAPHIPRGLMGHFFCASLEEQYEHLLGLWADRVPMGSEDGGHARDPLIGAHEPGDGVFEIPVAGHPALKVEGLTPFTRTRGIAYLFYPSVQTIRAIAGNALFLEEETD